MTVTSPALQEARARREEILFADWIDARVGWYLAQEDVSSESRMALEKLLKHYAKETAIFRTCVRDNAKRFGPGKVEKVCATFKEMIRGSFRWREINASQDTDYLGLSDDGREGLNLMIQLGADELEGWAKEITT